MFVVWYLFKTDTFRRINQLVANTRAIRFGESLPFVPTGKTDAPGVLEQETALASEQFHARREQPAYYVISTTGAQQNQIKGIRKLG